MRTNENRDNYIYEIFDKNIIEIVGPFQDICAPNLEFLAQKVPELHYDFKNLTTQTMVGNHDNIMRSF